MLFPITIIGTIYTYLIVLYKAKKSGISGTAADPLSYRWLLHYSGERTDEACEKLIEKLSIISIFDIKFSVFSMIVGMKLTGYIPKLFQFIEPGKETLIKMQNVRIEFFDRTIENHKNELDQFVIMGAGYDTRAYKFFQNGKIIVFEIDLEGTQTHKISALKEAGLETNFINFVPVDFNNESWVDKLILAGFQKGKRTLFLWEGVTLYLSEEVVKQTINAISEISGEGSVLAFDIYSQSFVNPKIFSWKMMGKLLDKTGEKFKFGIDMSKNPEEESIKLLKRSGFIVNRIRIMGKPKGSLGYFACVVEALK